MRTGISRRRARLVVATCVLGIVALAQGAEEPQAAYERIYGQQAAKLKPQEYPTFALQLINDAAALQDDPALAELLLTKAQDFYFRSSFGEEKTKAGEGLIERLLAIGDAQLGEGKAADADKTYQRAFKIASANKSPKLNDIRAKTQAVQARMDVDKKLADLLAKVKAKPDDAALARALVLLYVLELDQPGQAEPYLQTAGDEALRTYVTLATKEAATLEEQALKELGDWYASQAANAGPLGKAVAYGRAGVYYELFLEKHAKQDADSLAAKKALASVGRELEKLSAVGAPMSRGAREISLDCGNGVQIKLVLIPAGKFLMGSPETEKGRQPDEGPQRVVTISKAFYMGVTEVTQAQYEAVMGKNPSSFKDPNNPVEQVSWDDAVAFCKKLSEKTKKTVRLPTEAEWEYACRAGSRTAFYFGDDEKALGDFAWFDANSERKTHPVGRKRPNAAGLYDMSGNVWEWCSDWYADSYANATTQDPQGPPSGGSLVLRGGSWGLNPRFCRSASRRRLPPDFRYDIRGFRVAVVAGGVD